MIDKGKIETDFFNKFNEFLDLDNTKVKSLDTAKRQELIGKAKEYYQYLADSNISYGKLALDMVNNEGKFGMIANNHLKQQCVFDGIKVEQIPAIREQIIVSLAFHDMAMRKADNYNQSSDFCEPIENYHISVFRTLATEYAWGGLAFRELVGTGSWLKLYEQGGGDFDAIKLILKNHKKSQEYSSARLFDSMIYAWTTYHGGLGITDPYVNNVPFSPTVRSASKKYAAKLYNVPEDRVLEIDPYRRYQILPANPINEDSEPTNADALCTRLGMMLLSEAKRRSDCKSKIDKLVERSKKISEECNAKMRAMVQNFLEANGKNVSDDKDNIIAQMSAEICQIVDRMDAENNTLFAEKSAELNAETEIRKIAAVANQTLSTVSTTIIITNADIAARKQTEYESSLAQYKAQCESQIAAIKANYVSQIKQRLASTECDVQLKLNRIKQQAAAFDAEQGPILKDAVERLAQDENADVDDIIRQMDLRASTFLQSLQDVLK